MSIYYFFVNLLHSLFVWLFDIWHLFWTIWHLFDNLTSFWHFDFSFNLNHLSPSQGYFSCLGTFYVHLSQVWEVSGHLDEVQFDWSRSCLKPKCHPSGDSGSKPMNCRGLSKYSFTFDPFKSEHNLYTTSWYKPLLETFVCFFPMYGSNWNR